ncbi:MAG: hypothetical protein ACYYK0_01165 [Candidatus Eutrophobiaceae bacterium]
MKIFPMKSSIAIAALWLSLPIWANGEEPNLREMWRIIQSQQQRIADLERQLQEQANTLEQASAQRPNGAPEEQAQAEKEDSGSAAHHAHHAPSHEKASKSIIEGLDISGYGEMSYNNLDDRRKNNGEDDSINEVDLKRFVLEFMYAFKEDFRILTELELEHAEVSSEQDSHGHLALEKALVQWDVTPKHTLFAGIDLIPVGFIHIFHEPPTFYGVEHNSVETEIIPTTWSEAGIGVSGELAPNWQYKTLVHGGMTSPVERPDDSSDTEDAEDEDDGITLAPFALNPRAGRGYATKTQDQDIAWSGRLRYFLEDSVDASISAHYQRDVTGTKDEWDIRATLYSGQFEYQHPSGLGIRALLAEWNYDLPAVIKQKLGRDNLLGWYIEPQYRFALFGNLPGELGIFTRYSDWHGSGMQNNVQEETGMEDFTPYARYKSWQFGLNWWLRPEIVLKFEYLNEDSNDPVDVLWKGFRLGLGYQFGKDDDSHH